MNAFIQHLLHDVLMKRTQDKVLKLMRKLHWEDEEVCTAEMTSGLMADIPVHPFLFY